MANLDHTQQVVHPPTLSSMDADSPMSDSDDSPVASALLSPPETQRDRAARGASSNANGKRPRKDISNGFDTEDEIPSARQARSTQTSSTAPANSSAPLGETREHAASGYKWNKQEDEPGYAWTNKKAVDEHNRALDALIHRDVVIAGEQE